MHVTCHQSEFDEVHYEKHMQRQKSKKDRLVEVGQRLNDQCHGKILDSPYLTGINYIMCQCLTLVEGVSGLIRNSRAPPFSEPIFPIYLIPIMLLAITTMFYMPISYIVSLAAALPTFTSSIRSLQ